MGRTAEEFKFVRDKLKSVGKSIVDENYLEAAFTIGCLHEVCHRNYMDLSENEIMNSGSFKNSSD